MIMVQRLVLSLVFVLFASITPVMAASQFSGQIAIIDIQKVFTDSLAAKFARDIHQKERQEKQVAYNTKEQEVFKIQEEIKSLGADASVSLREEKIKHLNAETKKLTRLKEDLDAELKQREQELTNQVHLELNQVLVNFIKKENIKTIFPKTSVAVFDPLLDITDRIIKIYDSTTMKKRNDNSLLKNGQ
jgi:Skp family chaperone for outer membrane proteins